jgi:hypothetical protein
MNELSTPRPEEFGVAPVTNHSITDVQFSVVTGAGNVTLARQPDTPFGAAVVVLMLEGHTIVGNWLSTTVTVNEQKSWLPEASVALASTVVVPSGNVIPLIVVNGNVNPPSVLYLIGGVDNRQLSCAVEFHESLVCVYTHPAPADTVLFMLHWMVGIVLSATTTLNEHVVELPAASIAAYVTVVVPTLNWPPEGGPATLQIPAVPAGG